MPLPREQRTPRLLLRPMRDDDTEAFAAINADPRVMAHFPAPMSRRETEDSLARIQSHRVANDFGIWTVELAETPGLIGIVGLTRPSFEERFTPCVEVVWRLTAAHWGRGYATEAARASLAFGFEHLELNEILAWTSPHNLASLRVMEKLGMKRDGNCDFDHPRVPVGHRLRQHVVYRAQGEVFEKSDGV